MNKKGLIIVSVVFIGLALCGLVVKFSDSKVIVDDNVMQKDSVNKERFNKIIDEYKNAYNDRNNFFVQKGSGKSFSSEELHKIYPNVNAYSFNAYYSLAYCFYDIDKNGEDELIISGLPLITGGGNNMRRILDIYLWNGIEPEKLSKYDSSKYFVSYGIYDNDIITVDTTSDENNMYGYRYEYITQFFKVSKDGRSFEKVGDYVYAFNDIVVGDTDVVYIDVNTNEKFDEETYRKRIPTADAKVISDASLLWREIESK